VTLTGSEAAGARVAATAGKTIKRRCSSSVVDPFIVLADADVKTAATVACRARNQNNGQSCIAASASSSWNRWPTSRGALCRRRQGAEIGDPQGSRVQVGPLARPDLVDDLERQVERCSAARR